MRGAFAALLAAACAPGDGAIGDRRVALGAASVARTPLGGGEERVHVAIALDLDGEPHCLELAGVTSAGAPAFEVHEDGEGWIARGGCGGGEPRWTLNDAALAFGARRIGVRADVARLSDGALVGRIDGAAPLDP